MAAGLLVLGLIAVLFWRGPLSSKAGAESSERASGPADASGAPVAGQGSAKSAGNRPAGEQGGNRSGAGGGGKGGRPGGGRPPSLVVTAEVTEGVANDRLRVIGNGRANASANVVSLTNGVLTEVRVISGQRVQVGDVLAVLDSSEEQIARDRAARTYQDAARDSKRLAALFKSQTTTEVESNNALAAEADATLALRDAALKLARRSITAPIAGSIGIVDVQVGNYLTPQDVIATIDDRSSIIVEFRVPERLSTAVRVGQPITARAIAQKALSLTGEISAIGSRIEADSRTLPVRARLANPSDALRPGMSFELQLQFEGERFPSLNPLAVQWDSEGSFVWQVQDSKVHRTAINIVQRNARSVLVASELVPGDEVVTEGVLSLRQGSQVRTAGGGQGRQKGGDTGAGAGPAAAAGAKAGSGT